MTNFEQLVLEMRETQKEYFRTRDANVLNKALIKGLAPCVGR